MSNLYAPLRDMNQNKNTAPSMTNTLVHLSFLFLDTNPTKCKNAMLCERYVDDDNGQ